MQTVSNRLSILRNYLSLNDYVSFCVGQLGFRPCPEHISIANSYDIENFLLVLMARQSGKTQTISSKTLQYSLLHSGKKILIFAPAKDQAVEVLFGRIKLWIESNPFLMDMVRVNSKGMKLLMSDYVEFTNGSSIRCLSASDKSNVVGYTGDVIIMDEAQDISNMVVYQKIEPMLGSITNPKYIKIGTPRNILSHFYESWKQGKNGVTWKVEEYDWTKCSRLNKSLIEMYRKSNPHFETEYNLKWINNIKSFFTNDELSDLFIDYDLKHYFELFNSGRASKLYGVTSELYCGVDWAKINDYSVISFMLNEGGRIRMVGYHRMKGDYRTQINELITLLRIYKPLVIYMDSTGSTAEAIPDLLIGMGFPVESIKMSAKFKSTELYSVLRRLVNYRLLLLPKDDDIVKEFYDLEEHILSSNNIYPRISAPANGTDDICDSVALGCYGFRELVESSMDNTAREDNDMYTDVNEVINSVIQSKRVLSGKRDGVHYILGSDYNVYNDKSKDMGM